MREFVPRVPRVATVYRYFDGKDRLLYVGVTSAGVSRSVFHSKQAPWWHQAVRCTLEHFATRAEAELAEREAIVAENPLYNATWVDQPQLRIKYVDQKLWPSFFRVYPPEAELAHMMPGDGAWAMTLFLRQLRDAGWPALED